jgi:protein LSM14
MSQYIGKTISLISNKGLRYVGLLDNINADDATVALKSVRLFGTEGRMAQNGNPQFEVGPGTDIYDYVVFRGSDVKDLSVLDVPLDQVQPEPYVPASYPPQPMATGPSPTAAPTNTRAAPNATTTTESHTSQAQPAQAHQAPAPTGTNTARSQPSKSTPAAPTTTQEEQPQPGSVPKPAQRQQQTRPAQAKPQDHPQAARRAPEIPTDEFDFESANAKFTKDIEAEKEGEHAAYNKQSSFFDTISSSTEQRSSMRWSEEKDLNMDTFGQSSIQRDRGKGGRGGRGGRGGWRGRGNSNGNGNGTGNSNANWRGGRGGRGRGSLKTSDYDSKPEWA